eukprot:COSAG03_NODE_832_length_5683_cov_10.516112_6_plen_86_part_00
MWSRERLLQRTRLKRAQYRVLGTAKASKAADGSEKRDEQALEEAAELGLQPSTHEYDEEVYVSHRHTQTERERERERERETRARA